MVKDGRLLLGACIWFALVGLAVAAVGTSPLFGMWHEAMAHALYGQPELPAALQGSLSLLLGILGGSICGKWLATAAIVKFGGTWSKTPLWFGLLAWFFIDSSVSAAHGAWFNIWMINLAPLLTVGGLLAAWAPPDAPPAAAARAGDRLLVAVLVLMSLTGLVFAFWVTGPVMAPWLDAWRSTLLSGTSAQADLLLTFLGGPIGGTVFAHFALLAWAVHLRPRAAWIPLAVAGSVSTWFVVDATSSLAAGAAFNVLLIDLPCLVGVIAALGARSLLNRSATG